MADELAKQGIIVSSGGVRSIGLRYDVESFKKRPKALEAKVAQDGMVLTDRQLADFEKRLKVPTLIKFYCRLIEYELIH